MINKITGIINTIKATTKRANALAFVFKTLHAGSCANYPIKRSPHPSRNPSALASSLIKRRILWDAIVVKTA